MKQHLRLLHLEDNPLDAEIIRESLKTDDFECEQILVKTRQEYESAIAQGHLVETLSRQIKGRLTVESSSGARFQLFFNELACLTPA